MKQYIQTIPNVVIPLEHHPDSRGWRGRWLSRSILATKNSKRTNLAVYLYSSVGCYEKDKSVWTDTFRHISFRERSLCFPAVSRPFRIDFKTDATEVTTAGASTAATNEERLSPGGIVGFLLDYNQTPCWSKFDKFNGRLIVFPFTFCVTWHLRTYEKMTNTF